VNQPGNPQLKRLGLGLVFVAFALIPFAMVGLAIFHPSLSEQDYGAAVLYLMVPSGASLGAGFLILDLEIRLSRRKPK
jgi:hypothetical protein